ncbi:hypothetical protein Pmani_005219 [Petrolisthes manimaculis]|uniref:Uncharacterized protein n=1 Tax=Petrolisthes manimaculis TaxID=1843537 RepID=A0AAE1UN50_9EUCA|nr:hypothetical protein Pmani_005219 [Petrolisthes manimaculis]
MGEMNILVTVNIPVHQKVLTNHKTFTVFDAARLVGYIYECLPSPPIRTLLNETSTLINRHMQLTKPEKKIAASSSSQVSQLPRLRSHSFLVSGLTASSSQVSQLPRLRSHSFLVSGLTASDHYM